MDALGIEKVDLYGSHTGAHIATEMAIARPDRVGRVVLDGVGLFTPEEKRDYGANYAPAIAPDITGSQFHWALNFVRDQGWFFPYFKRDPAHNRNLGAPSVEGLHRTTVEVLKALTTYHHAYRAAFAHPDRERLPLLKAPTLIMADEEDPLKRGIDEAVALVPGSRGLLFRGAAAPDGLEQKARLIAEFLDSTLKSA
jgi:pimeloyl-ACP methyl ester carboxylesterase